MTSAAMQPRVRGEIPAAEGLSPVLAEIFAAAMVLNAFPAVVLAWKSTGTRLAARPDERQEADWHAAGDVLMDLRGHGGHLGWMFDPASQDVACRCGADPFESAATEGRAAA